MISSTVTIGSMEPTDTNVHEKIVYALSQNNNIDKSRDKTFIFRPPKEFVSDLDSDFLEIHLPDLLPFGRGGFGERRKKKISRAPLVAHVLNLSSRQFQQTDFVLLIYDMVTRLQVATLGLIHSI